MAAFRACLPAMVRSGTLSACAAALLTLVACGRDGGFSGGEVSRSWNPAAVKEVSGVPIATLRSELQTVLAKRPTYATKDQW